jgi:hypothetical protein
MDDRQEGIAAIPSPEAPKIAVVPLAGKPIAETVTLDYPLQYGECTISALVVRRMTVAQVDAVFQELKALKDDDTVSIAAHMVTLPDGEPVPPEIFGAMIDDDDTRVYQAIQRFLPPRLRPVFGSTPASADATSQPSQAD